jgi:hypothetical protein
MQLQGHAVRRLAILVITARSLRHTIASSSTADPFFGSHYERLKQIKMKYDADDLLLVAEGVGSDDWDTSLNCRLH